jgi:hypothetical protein
MKMKTTDIFNFREDKKVLLKAKKKAKANGTNLSVLIRQFIRDYIQG